MDDVSQSASSILTTVPPWPSLHYNPHSTPSQPPTRQALEPHNGAALDIHHLDVGVQGRGEVESAPRGGVDHPEVQPQPLAMKVDGEGGLELMRPVW